MSQRTQLLQNVKEKGDDPVLSKFIIEITQNEKINTSLEAWDIPKEEMTPEQMEDSAKWVIKFLKEDLIARAIKWNVDLWAKDVTLRVILNSWINQCSAMLMMKDREFEELIKACKDNEDE